MPPRPRPRGRGQDPRGRGQDPRGRGHKILASRGLEAEARPQGLTSLGGGEGHPPKKISQKMVFRQKQFRRDHCGRTPPGGAGEGEGGGVTPPHNFFLFKFFIWPKNSPKRPLRFLPQAARGCCWGGGGRGRKGGQPPPQFFPPIFLL